MGIVFYLSLCPLVYCLPHRKCSINVHGEWMLFSKAGTGLAWRWLLNPLHCQTKLAAESFCQRPHKSKKAFSHLHLSAPLIQSTPKSSSPGGHMRLQGKEEMTLCLLLHKQMHSCCIHCKYLITTLHVIVHVHCVTFIPYGLSFGTVCIPHSTPAVRSASQAVGTEILNCGSLDEAKWTNLSITQNCTERVN